MSPTLAVLVWLALPIAAVAIELAVLLRADRRRVISLDDDGPSCVRFEILVPIYGDIDLLENVEFLARYRERVVLCTTSDESDEFYDALTVLAWRHRFRVFHTDVGPRTAAGRRRGVDGPVRDTLIRDALRTVRAPYVVCLDADTLTTQPVEKLVGAVQAAGVDIASVRLVPANADGLLARLQGHEYRMAVRMRRLCPWLLSGACLVARTEVHREVMDRHSLFFQGNDAELGILAEALDYDIGHVRVDVPTAVPSTLRPWWRQRVAWAGGEVRTYAVNLRHGRNRRWCWFHGLVLVLLLAPLRWLALVEHPAPVGIVVVVYAVALVGVNWRTRDRSLLLLPLYLLFSALVLAPLGVVAYARTAIRHRNAGIVDPARWVETTPTVMTPDATRLPAAGSNGDGAAADPVTVSRCMAIAALGAWYSVPFHLGPDRLYVSSCRGEVRIARMVDAKPVIVARHPRVATGTWSILDVHLAADNSENPHDSSPTVDEIVDLWKQKIAPPPLPVRPRPVPDTGSR